MLSVFMITCNEEATLERALRSVQPIAGEIIVVDTGSTDRTKEIARACGAAVYDFAWSDDFSAARNFAAAKTRGEWVLCIDSDEEMLPSSYDIVRQCMERADALGFTVRWQNLVESDRPDVFTEMHPLRLFRRVENVKFVGRIHEHLEPPIEEIMRREGKRVFPSEIILRHTGYVKQKQRAKLERAAKLLELELRERPGQLYYQIEYGRTLLQLGDPRGHGILAEASRQVWAMRDRERPPMPLAAALIEYALTTKVPAENPMSPSAARYLAQRWFADSPPLLWLLAQQSFAANDFSQAAALLEQLVQCGKTGKYNEGLSFDPRILGEDAAFNLAVCRLRLAQLDEAHRLFAELKQSPTRGDQARQNLAIIEQLRQQ